MATGTPQFREYLGRIVRIYDHNLKTRSMFFVLPQGETLNYVPGQFISVSMHLGEEKRVRAYTLTSSPEDRGAFEICLDRVPGGKGAAYLFDRKVGDPLTFTGPFGTFVMGSATGGETVFIAEGTAVASIRPMLHRALSLPSGGQFCLLYAARTADGLLYRSEIEGLARQHHNFRIETLTFPESANREELYQNLLEETRTRWVEGDTIRNRQFYVSGIGAGVLAIRDLLRQSGYERRAVHYEKW